MKLAEKYGVSCTLEVEVTISISVEMDELDAELYDWDPKTGIIALTAKGQQRFTDEAEDAVSVSFYDYTIVDTNTAWRDGNFVITDEDFNEVDPDEVEPF